MADVYDAVENGDFTDPAEQHTWLRAETRRVRALTPTQLRYRARIATAELRRRGKDADIPDRAEVGLAMALMFTGGVVCGALFTLALYLVNA